MKKHISWNNQRHNYYYWISVMLLLFVATNISTPIATPYFRKNLFIIGNLFDTIFDFYKMLIPFFGVAGLQMCTWLTMDLIATLILGIANHLCGLLPDINFSEEPGNYRFLMKTVVLYDISIGLTLEVCAIKGLIALNKTFIITSVIIWIYIIILLAGSYLYWKSVIPLYGIRQIVRQLEHDRNYEKKIWFCISNSEERVSTFARAPWNGKFSEVFLDEKDLSGIKKERFIYYLIAIECSRELSENLKESISQIIRLPHSNVLVMLFGGKETSTQVNEIKILTSGHKNVRIKVFSEQHLNRQLNLEKLVSDINYRQIIDKQHPLKYIKNHELIKTYIEIGYGPQICLDFLKTIINKLDILPAIYALFDYIDLQYRIIIAYATQPDVRWMRHHGQIVGKISDMGKKINKQVFQENHKNGKIKLTTRDFFAEIITDTDMKLIRKYLLNYEKKEDLPIDETIRYLTSSLRNVLRGHGTFEHSDANVLFELVFKLALLNTYILSINAISLDVTGDIMWHEPNYYKIIGYESDNKTRMLSPFLVASENGNILVFNNWDKSHEHYDKNIIEYINYLDGTLFLAFERVQEH